MCLLPPGEFKVLSLQGLLALQKFLRREANSIRSLDKREPHLGLLASCLEAAAPPLQQKALLLLPPAENPAYVIIKNLTVVSTVFLRETTELPREYTDGKLFTGRPSGAGGAPGCTSRRGGSGIKPTCPILTNSAWRASSFFRADLGDSGKTSLKDRLLSMF